MACPSPSGSRPIWPGLKQFPTKIVVGQELAIKSVFYMGDEGGIMCDMTPPDMATTPVICSLTHLEVLPGHPLTDDLRAYQAALRASCVARERRHDELHDQAEEGETVIFRQPVQPNEGGSDAQCTTQPAKVSSPTNC